MRPNSPAEKLGQASGQPVQGVSDSVIPPPTLAPQAPGLQRRPEPSGLRPDPQAPQKTSP